MTELWAQFSEQLQKKLVSIDDLLRATPAELEEIFTEHGYRALERAQLRTMWYENRNRAAGAEIPMVAQTAIVPTPAREFTDVKILLEHYICPEPHMAVSIVELERVANPVLQKRFERRKAELSGGVNEVVVRRFHSPVLNNAKIQDVGFTLPSEESQQCFRFLTKAPATHPPGAYKLLLCDVAVGKYKAVSGDGASITPEQLASEAFDSVYLFYSGSAVDASTPDEFILFHPDQILPRHIVTFLVHASLGSPSHSPLRSPSSLHDSYDYSRRDLVAVQTQQPHKHGAPTKYWLVAENQLVNGDSLLVGEHRGKKFVSLTEGTETQVSELKTRRQVLDRSVDHLKAQLKELDVTKDRHEEVEAATISYVRSQADILLELLAERRDEAVRQVETKTRAVVSKMNEDYSTISSLLHTLEGYSERVQGMLSLSQSGQEDFVLKSSSFLQEMSAWQPSYSIHTSLSLPPPVEMNFDIEGALQATDALMLAEAQPSRPNHRTPRLHDKQPARERERVDRVRDVAYEKVVIEEGRTRSVSPDRASSVRAAAAAAARSKTPASLPPAAAAAAAAPNKNYLQHQHQQHQLQHQHQHQQHQHHRVASGTPTSQQLPPPAQAPNTHKHPPMQQLDFGNAWDGNTSMHGHPTPPLSATPVGGPAGGPAAPAAAAHKPRSRANSRSNTPNRRPNRSASRSGVPSFHVVLVGDAAVGKTRLMEAWLGEDPPRGDELAMYYPSLEPKSRHFTVITGKSKLSITMTDTPGSQLFPEAFATADAAVLVFDCTNHTSYDNISKWYSYLPHGVPVALCGNKSNESARVIKAKDITFHREVNTALKTKTPLVNYYDISVAARYNVDKPWTWICRKLLKDSHVVVKEIISTF